MECPICYNIINNSCIGSCTHHFCLECLIKWCEMGGIHCPICKTLIGEIRPDVEFNKINCPENAIFTTDNIGHKLTIDFSNNEPAGITLENNNIYGKRCHGVLITKINKNNLCYKLGLRKNDNILFINNVPCIDHKQTIAIIDNCSRIGIAMNCVLLKIRN